MCPNGRLPGPGGGGGVFMRRPGLQDGVHRMHARPAQTAAKSICTSHPLRGGPLVLMDMEIVQQVLFD